MPSSNPGRLHAILLIRNHSFFSRRTPAHGSGPTSKRSGCPRPNRRHVFLQRQRQDADLSRIRLPLLQLQGLHGAFQIRGRGPQQRIQTLQTLFGPRGQIGFGSLQGCWGGVRIKADHVSPLPQTCQRGPSLAKPFMRIALFAAFSGATCLWIRDFKAAPLGRSSLRIGEIPALTARGSLLSGLFL